MPFREIVQATALTAVRHPPKARALIFWLLTNRIARARTLRNTNISRKEPELAFEIEAGSGAAGIVTRLS